MPQLMAENVSSTTAKGPVWRAAIDTPTPFVTGEGLERFVFSLRFPFPMGEEDWEGERHGTHVLTTIVL